MDKASIDAHALLSALRAGDKVIVEGCGHTVGSLERPAVVDPYRTGMSRSDGSRGSFESTGLSIGWARGYTVRVQVDTLAGYGPVGSDGRRQVPPTARLHVVELGPASVERHHEITRLGAWAEGARR